MKTSSIAILLFFTAAVQGCKKYNQGPALSLLAKDTRVANNWSVDQYWEDNAERTGGFNSSHHEYNEHYTKEGVYTFSYYDSFSKLTGDTGTWEFQDNKMEIRRTSAKGQNPATLNILRLKQNSFWYWYMDGNVRKEVHLETN